MVRGREPNSRRDPNLPSALGALGKFGSRRLFGSRPLTMDSPQIFLDVSLITSDPLNTDKFRSLRPCLERLCGRRHVKYRYLTWRNNNLRSPKRGFDSRLPYSQRLALFVLDLDASFRTRSFHPGLALPQNPNPNFYPPASSARGILGR